jgi:cytochrome c biogenesis protein CcmG/thiol:disulfide interchange protein DsbE
MSKQWLAVIAVIAGLGLGATALVKYGPEREPVAVGARAPDFRVLDLATGDTVSLRSRYRGSVTLVNIWATWCEPCKVEMPAMQRLYDSFGPRGFKIAAVSIDEGDATDVRNFSESLHLTFDVLQDRSTAIQQAYQTTGVPESFLLDRDGTIMKRVIGAHDWSSPVNRALVERLLSEGKTGS